MKKALLAVSFGTTVAEADRRCIRPIEDALQAAFPDREVRRAFTSRIILKKLAERGESAPGVPEALDRLRNDGFGSVLVAPLFVIPGGEYDRACDLAKGLPVAGPLLHTDGDLRRMAALFSRIAREENRPLLMMGHGTDHAADSVYARLRAFLPENVFLACMEGAHGLESIIPRLEALPERAIAVMPLMLCAGSHARDRLSGDQPGSWKTALEDLGFDVRIRMQGLGELAEVRQMFADKLKSIPQPPANILQVE